MKFAPFHIIYTYWAIKPEEYWGGPAVLCMFYKAHMHKKLKNTGIWFISDSETHTHTFPARKRQLALLCGKSLHLMQQFIYCWVRPVSYIQPNYKSLPFEATPTGCPAGLLLTVWTTYYAAYEKLAHPQQLSGRVIVPKLAPAVKLMIGTVSAPASQREGKPAGQWGRDRNRALGIMKELWRWSSKWDLWGDYLGGLLL